MSAIANSVYQGNGNLKIIEAFAMPQRSGDSIRQFKSLLINLGVRDTNEFINDIYKNLFADAGYAILLTQERLLQTEFNEGLRSHELTHYNQTIKQQKVIQPAIYKNLRQYFENPLEKEAFIN